MTAEADLVIRNAYLQDRDDVVDVAVREGKIFEVAQLGDPTAEREINAEGNLVSPGFVDCHKHVDRAFAARGERKPSGFDEPFSERDINALFDDYYKDASRSEIEENAIRDLQNAVAAGTTHVRSHVGVDHTVGTDTMTACLRAKERTSDIIDVQLVPAAFGGVTDGDAERWVREAMELGLDAASDRSEVLVGGTDPGSTNDDVTGTIETWFEIATDFDVGIDVHIQDGGSLGLHTLEQLVAETRNHDYAGRVTASHCFSLAQASDWWLKELIGAFTDVDLSIVTCYNSVRCNMPVQELAASDVQLGHGTDNDRDFVIPHGNADSLEAAKIMSLKLHGTERRSETYRWSESNPGIDVLWDLLTVQGADVLGVRSYGIEEGADADLVVFDEPSRQWSVIAQAERTYVLKRGNVIAREGELLPEYRIV